MPKCRNPIEMFRDQYGNVITHNCKGDAHTSFHVPCGQCIFCRLNHSESWALRMVHHAKYFSENSFITLTYDEENLPSAGSLQYEDVTKFVKRLKSRLEKTPYKNIVQYYRAGEYGSDHGRPHYHIIIFGFDFTYPIKYKKQINVRTVSGKKDERTYYKSTFLTDLWGKGHADVGNVDYATCMYVGKYTLKRIRGEKEFAAYERLNEYGEYVQIARERSAMSKGIGKQWLQDFYKDVFPHNYVHHRGKKYKVPRYYDNWLEKNDPILFEQVKLIREESMVGLQPTPTDNIRELKHQLLKQQQFSRKGDAPLLSNDKAVIQRFEEEQEQLRKKNV